MLRNFGTSGFVFVSAVALYVLGATLVRAIFAAGPILAGPDVLLPFSNGVALYSVAFGSFLTSAVLLIGGKRQLLLKLYALAWFAGNLCVYQGAALWIHGADLLGCIGNLDHRIPISPRILAPTLTAFFAVLFLTDLSLIILHSAKRLKAKRREAPETTSGQATLALNQS